MSTEYEALRELMARHGMLSLFTKQSLRERFKLPERKAESVTRTIRDTMEAGKIKLFDPKQRSLRYRSYVPHWA